MIRGEMEFEFSENQGGQFMASGKVVTFIRQHLAKGNIDEAVQLYESCVENVGDALFLEFKVASKVVQKAMANLFYRARDYRRAAAACETIGEYGAAARAYEAASQWQKAAEMFLKAGTKDRAAAMFEKAGDPRKAAELYFGAGDTTAAINALAGAGDRLGAANLAVRAGDKKRAAQELALVAPSDPKYPVALSELADLLAELGRRDLAIQRLAAALPANRKIADATQAELVYKLGLNLAASNRNNDARGAFELVTAWNPSYKDVAARLAALPGDTTGAAKIPSAARGQASMTGAPTSPGIPMSMTSPGVAGLPTSLEATQQPLDTGYVTRMPGYELLKTLPIFEDLSLDEMKDFYHLCEKVSFEPGEVLIEQGRPGMALYIVRSGSLHVVAVEPNGVERALTTLPAGKFVGEMALIDEAPTSARVKAAEKVVAFRIKKDAFRSYLYTHDLVAMRVYRSFTRTLAERLRENNQRLAKLSAR